MKRLDENNLAQVARIEKQSIDCPWSEEVLRKEINNPNFAVLEIDGRVIGYGSYYVTVDVANINNVAIDEPFRGKGYSKKIMEYLVLKAKSDGLSSMTLEVASTNFIAIRLYESFGFTAEGRRKNYYPSGDDALIMWLRFS